MVPRNCAWGLALVKGSKMEAKVHPMTMFAIRVQSWICLVSAAIFVVYLGIVSQQPAAPPAQGVATEEGMILLQATIVMGASGFAKMFLDPPQPSSDN